MGPSRRDAGFSGTVLRLAGAAAVCLISCGSTPALAELTGPSVPPPPGCAAITISQAAASGGAVCVHRVLVVSTTNGEANSSTFTVTDHVASLTATFRNWWPQGPPTAGMVITFWAHFAGGQWVVDRWIDLTHGLGPAPNGPYRAARLLDVSAGLVPLHRMVWVPAIVFLLDPQDTGDGDIHAQTFSACPGAGLTTEATPPLRGYVDHPRIPGLSSSSDTSDKAHDHLADAPPIGLPVMILGQVRYDYGFGWYEIHPIRAWRPMTAGELAEAALQCARDPIPHLGPGPTIGGLTVPAPFGVPPCTDGSEFGTPPGFGLCSGPRCYVAQTAIDQLETLAGNCPLTVQPQRTPSQEGLPERLPGTGQGILPADELEGLADSGVLEHERSDQVRYLSQAVVDAYGGLCRRAGETDASGITTCSEELAHLVTEAILPARACSQERRPDRSACVRAARVLARRLAGR